MSTPQTGPEASIAPKRHRNATATKDAILQAALKAFAQSGYDGVGLREIARAAGVDPRMVGYYFESKEKLFEAVVDFSMDLPLSVPTMTGDWATRLLTQSQAPRQADGFLLTLRSTSNPKAVEILRNCVERNYERALAAELGDEHAHGRAALLIAITMGVLLMREVLGNAALTSADAADLVPNMRAAFRAAASPSPGQPQHPA
jgi:AcrR family transcriptional regulator